MRLRVLAEDRRPHPAEFGRGADPEVLGEVVAGPFVHLQRLGLASQPRQRRHQMADQALPRGVPACLGFEARRHFLGRPQGQLGLRAGFHRGQPELFQPVRLVVQRGVRVELRVRRAVPQAECGGEPVTGAARVTGFEQAPSVGHQVLEAEDVDLLRVQLQYVPRRAVAQERCALGGGRGVEGAAQVRDVTLQRGDRVARRLLAPQLLDEEFGGHHPAQADEQQREKCPLARRSERPVAPLVPYGHGAQNAQPGNVGTIAP